MIKGETENRIPVVKLLRGNGSAPERLNSPLYTTIYRHFTPDSTSTAALNFSISKFRYLISVLNTRGDLVP